MSKVGKLLGVLGLLVLFAFVITGCGGEKKASVENKANTVDLELQAKVKGYVAGVEKPLADLPKILEKLEGVYQDLGYQRIDKEAGRAELKNILNEMLANYDLLIDAADKNSCPEVDEVVSFINGALYREKESLEHVIQTDLSKAELNQSLETMRDSKRQIDKGMRNLEQLKQKVGLGQSS